MLPKQYFGGEVHQKHVYDIINNTGSNLLIALHSHTRHFHKQVLH